MQSAKLPLLGLARRPVRSVLTAAGVGTAVAGYVMMMGLSRGIDRTWVQSLETRGADLLVVRKGAVEILATSVEESLIDNLRSRPEVADAAGELVDIVPISDTDTALAYGWAPGSFLWNSLKLEAGRLPQTADTRSVVVGARVAHVLQLGVRSTVSVLGEPFTVVGISRSGGTLLDNAIVMPIAELRALLSRETGVTAIDLRLGADAARELPQTLERLAQAFPGLSFTETAAVAEQNRVLSLLRAISWLTSVIALIVAVVAVVNTLLMSVTERTREIGILSSVGWSRRRIMSLILTESLWLCAAGGVIGALAGRESVRYLATSTMIRGWIEPDVPWRLLAEAAAAAVLLGAVASSYPAWRAASVPPAAALRHE